MIKYFIIFLLFIELLSAEFLKGRVIVLGERYGREGFSVNILYTDVNNTTIKNGFFKLNLNDDYSPGDPITLTIDKPNWHIHNPSNGRFVLPKSHYIEIEIVESTNKNYTKTRQKINDKYCVQISSFKSKSAAEEEIQRFTNKWKKKYNAYINTVNGIHKVLVTMSPYSESNIRKLHQKIIKVPRYKKSKSFIKRDCR